MTDPVRLCDSSRSQRRFAFRPPEARAYRGRAGRRLNAAQDLYEGSWVQALDPRLKAVDFLSWTTIVGAELLWSALPFIILLSSLANQRWTTI
jgi:hypothetical protein